jgi:hypothetical protein
MEVIRKSGGFFGRVLLSLYLYEFQIEDGKIAQAKAARRAKSPQRFAVSCRGFWLQPQRFL